MSNNLKVCVITGGNRGIGLFITKKYLEEGYVVYVGARTTIDFTHPNLYFVKTDVRKEDDIKNLIYQASTYNGNINVLVNNAGYSKWKRLDEITTEDLVSIYETNLYSVYLTSKYSLEYMKQNSVIINISSIAGKRGSENNSMYCGTKFGMNGVTQSLAKELGIYGIRVNGVCPVLIKTKGLVDALSSDDSPAENIDEFLRGFTKKQTALNSLPTAEDVSEMCIFLSSERAKSITGQNINVDCGVLPQ